MKRGTKVYTLGYQGLKIEDYISVLKNNNIGLVIDVREVAWSYKHGFSKSLFEKYLNESGIQYIHLKAAGNPSENRKSSKTIKECLRNYKKHLNSNDECIELILEHINQAYKKGVSSCLTCFEHSHLECHRSVLIEFMLEHSTFIPIHLKEVIAKKNETNQVSMTF